MVQGALNATNICFEAVGEVELLSTVAARAQHLMDAGKMSDFAKLAELSAAGSVSAYANVLGKFVQCFGEYLVHGGQVCQLGKRVLCD